MKVLQAIGLIGAGVTIGLMGSGLMLPVKAEQTTVATRFRSVYNEKFMGNSAIHLVKDEKSGACWVLAYHYNSSPTMAVAPANACK